MLKIGVIGAGHLGKFHLNNWMEIEGVTVVGFCDTDDNNAKSVIEKYKIPRFETTEALIDNCDAVDIVAPTTYHYELCALAIRKGKHVFVEKPLTNTMDEAKALLKLSKESNLKFQVGHVERFNPAFVALKDHVIEPVFIEVHRLSQFNPRGTDVSVILDLMIHDIDIILHLVKSNVSYISANGVAVLSDTPDIANVRIEFDNGCVANLTSSRISMKKMRKMRLFQKDAYIGIDFLDKKTEIISQNSTTDKNVFTFDIDTGKGKKTVAIANPIVLDTNAMKEELIAFKNAIINNTETPVTVVDGYRAMEVAHQILDKIKQASR
ncbi:Gfo/Idh/MocA family protein [Ferruginibacter yonginensis]|uniref:Gfo/Idh/MocA family protein n=1 Tax=Ferruginibacter yonginensis TaxID=1310416 RepID=A0ABV8QPF3_9BACT